MFLFCLIQPYETVSEVMQSLCPFWKSDQVPIRSLGNQFNFALRKTLVLWNSK